MTDRAVLFSIKPKYCELIASGKKTVDVRKTRPKIPTPFKGYIYCTKGETVYFPRDIFGNEALNGKVIGEFVCDYISMNIKGYNQDGVPAYWTLLNGSCLTADELDDYGRGKPLYGLHISELKIYDKPKELCEFYRSCGDNPKCKECEWLTANKNKYGEIYQDCGSEYEGMKPLYNDRPPQSWCYVQEVK